ncbi:MAG: glycosyltransferase [Blastocatellia bacterium]|nr:glycosyltransferase [Blastocatellia bacterium]
MSLELKTDISEFSVEKELHESAGKCLASIVITTKNRRDELQQALRSALSQSISAEILVVDDGSTDGTAEMVQAEYPQVRLERSEESLGCIVQRNRAARMASGDFIFSIDDDAIFGSPHTVAQTIAEFTDPLIGAIAIPYTEPRKSQVIHQKAPVDEGIFITDDFIGTAHALRRETFLDLGGYREELFHQGEEKDFCIRMLEAGYLVRLGRADLIHHMESPKRDFRRMDYYGRRNDILFIWQNAPLNYLLLHLVGTAINGLRSAAGISRRWTMIRGVAGGYLACLKLWNTRNPVCRRTYRLYRKLKKKGPLELSLVTSQLAASTRKSELKRNRTS